MPIMLPPSVRESVMRYLVGIPIFLGIYLGLILLYFYPHWPADSLGWLVLILVGIPVSFCLEWIGNYFFSKETGSKKTEKRFSVKRIALGLFVFISIAGGLGLLWVLFGFHIRPHFL
jgi:uncharacterized protein YqgC (DUF456 family)